MTKENEGNFGKFPSEGQPQWAWRRCVVKPNFLSFRMRGTRVRLFAAGDSGVRKELKMQEIKKLILLGREGSDGGHNMEGLSLHSSIQGWKRQVDVCVNDETIRQCSLTVALFTDL